MKHFNDPSRIEEARLPWTIWGSTTEYANFVQDSEMQRLPMMRNPFLRHHLNLEAALMGAGSAEHTETVEPANVSPITPSGSVSGDRNILSTTQPSEPMLAWVAFTETERQNAKFRMLENFSAQCSVGSIDVGDVGEMVACLILLFAFDKLQDAELPKPQIFSKFMGSLYGEKTIKNSAHKHDGSYSKKLSQVWKEGYVFFTHYSRLQGELTQEAL